MKKLILLLFLAFSFTISYATNITAFNTTDPILCDNQTGEITAFTDATGPIAYDLHYLNTNGNWQVVIDTTLTFSANIVMPGLPGAEYRVRIFNASTLVLEATATHDLLEPMPITSTGNSTTDVSCFGGNDGTASVNVMGGTVPYYYQWSDGQTTQTAIGLSSGTYTCLVTDSNACAFSGNPISLIISEPSNSVNPNGPFGSQIDVFCHGDSTGYLSINPTGGTAPYSFLWAPNGDTTSSISDLPAGTYVCVVTDDNGCNQGSFTSLSAGSNYIITQPLTPLTVSKSQTDVICHGGSTGIATILAVNGSGTAPYTYLWDNNGSTSSTINNLSAGTYLCTITDDNGCSFIDSVVITEPATPLISVNQSIDVSCFGGSNGAASVLVSGGGTSYSYSWLNNGSTFSDIYGLTANTYFVDITDNLGCLIQDTVIVNEPTQISAIFNVDTAISCNVGHDGVLSADVSGGTPNYTYTWTSNVTGFSYNDSVASNISEGLYTVNILDSNLCTNNFSIQVNDPDPIDLTNYTQTNISCFGGNDGQINLTVLGATPPYTYTWSNANGQTTSSISSLNANTYTVIVQDANGCYGNLGGATQSFLLIEPNAALTTSYSLSDVVCNGQANGTLEGFGQGGTPPYSYSWIGPGSYTSTGSYIDSLVAGTYDLTVTDANGCQDHLSLDIDEPDAITLITSPTQPSCYGYSDGMAAVIVSGGTGSYTYNWNSTQLSNSQSGHTIASLTAGIYTVEVYDSTLICPAFASINIGQPSPIVVSVFTNDNLCFGSSIGTANTAVTDPFPPFSYHWSNNDSTSNISNLSAGNYNLTVVNQNGCIQTDMFVNGSNTTSSSFDILEPTAIALSSIVSDITAFGADDGEILLTTSGGTSPYTYAWTGPASTNYVNGYTSTLSNLNNLVAGIYDVQITDSSGCQFLQSFVINEPGCNVVIDTTYSSPLCHDDNAQELTWTVSGGVGPYTSQLTDNSSNSPWYGPNSGLSTVTLFNTLPPGMYTILATDMSNCSAILTMPIISPDSMIIDFTATDVECYGNNTGSLSAIASGGTPGSGSNYTYLWSPNNQTSFNISNLIAGTYSVLVTDANSCQTTNSHTITQADQLIIDSINSTLISCNPGVDGSATAFVSGGVQPYYYIWTLPNSGISQTTQTVSGLSTSGNYSVDITDHNGCINSSNVTISNAPSLLLSNSVTQPLCYGDTNGIVYALASGGTAPFTYAWSINGTPGIFSSNSFIANLSPATYSVIVEDTYGCENQFSTQINNPALLTISLSVINVSLNGANDGSITSLVSGGTGSGTYTYAWFGPNGFTSTQANISFLYAGTYSLIVTDGNDCETTYLQVVNEPACNLSFDPNLTYITQPLCFGQTGQVTWMVSGGGQVLSPTTLTNNITGTILFSQTTSPGQVYSQTLTDGNYSLYVEDEYGCSDIMNFTISTPNVLTANVITDSVSCFGGSDGSMSLQGIGGTAPYYPNYGTHPITGVPIDSNNLTAGTYIVTITDDNGCTSSPISFIVNIYEPNQLIVNSTTVPVTCYGASDGEINLSVFGGTAPYTYTWTGNLIGTTTPIVSNLTANTYFVTVTDDNGCNSNPQITTVLVSGPGANINVSINATDASCFGLSDGQAQAFPTGGTAPYTYEWNDGQTTQIAIGLTSGTYTCIVTDANGCIDYENTQVGEPNEILSNLSTVDVSCFGLSDGSALVNPTGGSGNGFVMSWSVINPLTLQPFTSLNVSNLFGVYNVTITDLSLPGCDITDQFAISQPDILQITPNTQQIVSCSGGSDGSLSVDVLGGTTPYTYNWSSSSNNSISTNQTAINLSSQMYSIEVVDYNGCSFLDSIFLNSNLQITPNLSFDNVSCYGGNDGIAYSNPTGGTAPYAYFWNITGSTNSSSSGYNADTLTYNVIVTDINNCSSGFINFSIPQPDSITMYVSVDSVTCFMGTNGQINIDSISGAVGPYTYLWSNGQTTDSTTNLIAGSYTCIVTDALGCIDSSNTYVVYEPLDIFAAITITTNYNGSNVNCYNDSNGELTATAVGGVGSYTYLWSTGETTSFIDGLNAGTYSVTITDTNGCSDDALITLINPDTIHFNYSVSNYNGNNISCNGFSDGTIEVNITGGSGIDFSTIIWTDINGVLIPPSNIINDTTLINITAGTYNIYVEDVNGCPDSSFMILTEPDVLTNYFTTDSVSCHNGNDGSAYTNVIGGTAPYSYAWTITASDSSSTHNLIANTNYQVSIQDNNGCPILLDNIQILQPDSIYLTTILTLPTCYGINDGEILIDIIVGGTGGYSYLWSNGQTGTIVNNLYGDSVYSCIVTDAIGCQDSSYFVYLPQPDTLIANIDSTINYNGTDVQCFGDTNGSILASALGGTNPYTYEWTQNFQVIAQTDSLNNIGAGTYVITITDTNGCQNIATYTIVDPNPISINYTVSNYNGSNISCSDSLDGFINTVISGGNGINSFLWNTNETTASIDSLSSGDYKLIVLDNNGCKDSLELTLIEPNPISLSFTFYPVTCFGGNDGAAVVNPSGGTAPYQISWSTFGSGSFNDSIFGLNGSTNYTVQVSDTNNCPMVLNTITIPQPNSIQTTDSITLPTCFGQTDGQIIITSVTGATGPYTYQWNDTFSSTGTILSNITSGEYICTITDALGCAEDVLFLVDTVYTVIASATVISNYQGADVECYGDNNASVQGSAVGGTPPYSYTWSSGQNTDIITNVGAGPYTVFVTDSNACTSLATEYVINPDSITASIQVSDYNGYSVSCDGLSDGSATAIVSGGNGIDFNTLLWNTLDDVPTLNNLSVNTYSYTIEDINGCIASAQVTLTSPAAMQLTLAADNLLCYGDSNATAFIDAFYNGISPFNYLWDNGQNNSTATNLSNGTYTLTITDTNNCTVSSIVDVSQPDSLETLLTITSFYNGYDISCYDSLDANVDVATIGGTAPYLYSLDASYYSSSSNYNNLGAGNFVVLTRDVNGCESIDSVLISSPDQLESNLQIINNPTCNGVNDGVITSLTSGGTGIYSYNWSTNTSTTNIINSLSIGTYSVVISDNNGCYISDSLLLDPVFTLSSNMSSTQVTCTGYSDGTANISVLDGTQPYSYSWDNGVTSSNTFGLSAGNYTVLVTDANNCQLTESVLITESDSALSFTANITDLSCYQNNSGLISTTVIGGVGPYTYTWSTGSTDSTITNLSSGSYILSVIDSIGCIVDETFVVVEPLPLTYTLSSVDISCFGLGDGNANLTVNGGTLPYTYNWTGPNNYTALSANINSLTAGSYVMIVTDSNGCDLNDLISISEPLPLITVVSSEDPLCYNINNGSIMVSVEGGIAPYTSVYGTINPTAILTNPTDSIIYQNLAAGSNLLSVYDANNCENSYTVTLMNPLELSIANILTTDPSCYNYSNATASIEVLGGTLPYTYQLNDADNNTLTGSSNYIDLSFGSYAYIVIDANGCDDTTFFNISNPNEITINSSLILDVNCYNGNTGSIEVEVDNTVGDYQIVWMPTEFNSDSELITDLIAGNYEAVVIDENGCTKLDSFFINQNDEIDIDMSVVNSSCSLSVDGQIIINNIIGGIPPYNVYNNSLLVGSEIISDLTIGSLITTEGISPYNLTITDNYDCQYSSSVNIGFDGGYGCVDEPIIITPNYDGYNDTWIPILDLNTEIEVSILNRWGEKEFTYVGNSLAFSWDGFANWGKDHDLPSSDYYYIIKFNNDNYPAKTGVITLIR
ncbi:gliding motility-associated C-terminal domain-containing protein [Flavobacteriales bacterium]|nr:gliding motility-associated C-terminal domain-containing protein [Flavobacteriales bacterium]